ncbi:hypothetical protein M1N92_05250, partial [Dehalococcoidia bacterium]|nr:hypothetical protein [Dehalococcoidia bacterium]
MKIVSKTRPGAGGAFLALLLALSLTLSLGTPALGTAPPPAPPHFFYGAVTIGDQPAPEGTVVSARVAGVEVASTTVDAYGEYELEVFDRPDDTIDFYVADVWAASYPWKWGGVTRLDLAIPGFDFSLAVYPTA